MAASAADASPRKKAEVDEDRFLYEALPGYSGEISGAATAGFRLQWHRRFSGAFLF
jgi:hypothetical protein